jgi:hypothetical protein
MWSRRGFFKKQDCATAQSDGPTVTRLCDGGAARRFVWRQARRDARARGKRHPRRQEVIDAHVQRIDGQHSLRVRMDEKEMDRRTVTLGEHSRSSIRHAAVGQQ